MRKSVVIAEALCLVGAAAIGLIYSDRLNRERERREHIEATGAKALSTVRELRLTDSQKYILCRRKNIQLCAIQT